jgi:hypothetical protein
MHITPRYDTSHPRDDLRDPGRARAAFPLAPGEGRKHVNTIVNQPRIIPTDHTVNEKRSRPHHSGHWLAIRRGELRAQLSDSRVGTGG